MHERHASAVAVKIQRRFSRGVLASDDHNVLPPEWVGLGVIVRNVRQLLAGHPQSVGQIVVAGGHHDFPRRIGRDLTVGRARVHLKLAVGAANIRNLLSQAQFQLIVLSRLAVILECFDASRLLCRTDQRQIADFEQLRGGKENHVHRIVIERVAEATFVDDQRAHSGALGLYRTGQAGGTRADAE